MSRTIRTSRSPGFARHGRWKGGLALLATLALLLSACGGDPDDDAAEAPADDAPDDTDEAAEEDADEDGEADAPDDGEDVTLEVYSWRTEDAEAYGEIFAAFEAEHPGITVDFTPYSATDYNQILQTALQSGAGPDILQLRPYMAGQEIADQGYLEPLDDLEGIDQFPEEFLDASRGEDGQVYGVPLATNATMILTNRALFEEHGLSEPTTWSELLDVSEEFQSAGIVPFAQAADEAWLLSLAHAAVAPGAYGEQFVEDIREGTTDFTDPGFRASIERMDELQQYFPDNFVGISDQEASTMFATEEAAMIIHGDFQLDTILDLNPDLDVGVVPSLPDDDGEALLTTWVDGSYAAYADTDHPEEARQLLAYMTTQEFGEAFTNLLNRTSPVPGVEADSELRRELIELTAEQSTPYLILTDFAGSSPNTKEEFENALQGMYVGELEVGDVEDTAQRSAEQWYEPFQ